MAIRATCSGCGKTVKGGDDWAGRSAKCPGCGGAIRFANPDPFDGFAEFAAGEHLRSVSQELVGAPPPLLKAHDTSSGYEYHMVQIPPAIVVAESRGSEAANYLQSVVQQHARNGWEFYRLDSIGVQVSPGCLGFLMGIRHERQEYYVITFRKPAQIK